jgi:hypothetical protein
MNLQPKPTLVNVIAWMTLASGIVNIFWGIAAISTFIGFICAPLSILPVMLGVFEIIYAAKLFSNTAEPVKPSTNIAVFEIASVLFGNVFSMAVGILSLVFYNDVVVKDYFARLNGMLVNVPPVTHPTVSQPEAVIEETFDVEDNNVDNTVSTEESPARPKRTSRKTTNG